MLEAVDAGRERVEPARELVAHGLERRLELGQRLLDLRASGRVDVERRTNATSSCADVGSARSVDASSPTGAAAAVGLVDVDVGAAARFRLSPAVSVRPAILSFKVQSSLLGFAPSPTERVFGCSA